MRLFGRRAGCDCFVAFSDLRFQEQGFVRQPRFARRRAMGPARNDAPGIVFQDAFDPAKESDDAAAEGEPVGYGEREISMPLTFESFEADSGL